jgi:AcrR family transcriptional regulator
MSAEDTRERILDAAEALFAERGISGTALRTITKAAHANLASVHYHFGSKESLLDAVVERRARPINRERLRTLEALERAAVETPLAVEDILNAFLLPGVQTLEAMPDKREQLTRLVARIEAQPPEVVEALFRKHFGSVGKRFVEAMQRALPHLPKETVSDRFRFAGGILSYVFSGNFDLDLIPDHPPHAASMAEKLEQVIGFLAAGLRAPVPGTSRP